jgi:copper homeostasis protein
MNIIKESCVETIQECIIAEKKGASRIELCADLHQGGVTPSYGVVQSAKKILKIPVFVIIRPRGGNFNYDEIEMEIMKNDIDILKRDLEVDGFVFGILTEDNLIDYEKNKILVDLIRKIDEEEGIKAKLQSNNSSRTSITFHMAFDFIQEEKKIESIDLLVSLGFDRILTKGCETNAVDGIENIKKYVEYANGRISIMPGGKVTKDNYKTFLKDTKCFEVHGTKIVDK